MLWRIFNYFWGGKGLINPTKNVFDLSILGDKERFFVVCGSRICNVGDSTV